ncbi:putative uncharacterized protein DDB_G0289263 isoform X1 [Frieseomelitta varia]|uniref:putative uncharacterized protein DDB_G0289263 isoform X1 n=1 Tax=Frieseomelitta varia TaxID=561572 RepID=UPI001CB69EAF|nr:putative uncharacterized protein DDB_G0289263 isoform X1 [Frieseomelitta varia]
MSESTVYLDRELRKLKPAELYKLAQILCIQDSWKKLMAIIPKDDDSDLPKFNIEHISMIEQAAQQQGNAVEIFLSEWGTMGKKRPTLRFLLNLLIKAQLFRAADYVAGELLNAEELPKRPQFGPAAPVDISEEINRVSLKDNEKLENLNYNESLIFGLASQVVDNETINPNATNNSSFERNMQSTKLISSEGEHNKEQLQNDKETSNAQISDLMKLNSKGNAEKPRKQKQIFDQQEMSSDELPVFLNEFEQSVEQTKFNREVPSEELPLFLNNNTTSSNEMSNYKINDLSNCKPNNLSNRNRNEITSTELPQCIVEFRVNNVFDSNNSCGPENYANIAQNAVSSTELPITVLEYNE